MSLLGRSKKALYSASTARLITSSTRLIRANTTLLTRILCVVLGSWTKICNLMTPTTGLRSAHLPVPPQARMVTLPRTGRSPDRVHNARPAHPHCASSRLRKPRPIQHIIPRSRQTRRVQIRPRPSPSWLDHAQVDDDGTNCPTATRWVSTFLKRRVAVLRGRDQYQRRLFDIFDAVVGGRT